MFTSRKPQQPGKSRSETGAGTYAIFVAVLLSAGAAMVFVDGTYGPQSEPMTLSFPEGGAMWLEAHGQPAPRNDAGAATSQPAAATSNSEIKGADPTKQQPVYDEAGAISIYTR